MLRRDSCCMGKFPLLSFGNMATLVSDMAISVAPHSEHSDTEYLLFEALTLLQHTLAT